MSSLGEALRIASRRSRCRRGRATGRRSARRSQPPRRAARELDGRRCAFVFGTEPAARERGHVRLPVPRPHPRQRGYGSLNLAPSRAADRLRLMAPAPRVASRPKRARAAALADAEAVAVCSSTGGSALVKIGFLDPEAPKLLARLHRLFSRGRSSTREEVQILRGLPGRCEKRWPEELTQNSSDNSTRSRMFTRLRADIACILDRDPAARSHVGGAHLLSGPACDSTSTGSRTGSGAAACAGWAASSRTVAAGSPASRSTPARDRQLRLHRSRHGRRDRRDRRSRRRLHDLPGRHAGRHLAVPGAKRHPDARPTAWSSAPARRCSAASLVGDNARIGSNAVVVKPVPPVPRRSEFPARIVEDPTHEERRTLRCLRGGP